MPDQVAVPDWVLTMVGRQTVLAEMQRVGDAAIIAALQKKVQELTPLDSAAPAVVSAPPDAED